MRIDNPNFTQGSKTEGIHIADGVKTPTGTGLNLFKDDGTLIPISSIGGSNETLQTVTNRGNSTTQPIQSTNYLEAYSGVNSYTRINPTNISGFGTSTNRMSISYNGGYIDFNKSSIYRMRLQFPDGVTANQVLSLPNKSGTIATLDDITGGDDNYVDSVTFSNATGVLTLGRTGGLPNLTTSLDGRYLTQNQTINISGDVVGSGETAITTTLTPAAITTKPALTSGLISTDELLVSDSGVLKKMGISVLQTYMQNNLDFGTAPDDKYVDSVAFDSNTGVLTLGRTGILPDLTASLDGRYALSADLNNVAYLNQVQTFTAQQTFSGGVVMASTLNFGAGQQAIFDSTLLIRKNQAGSFGEIYNTSNNLDLFNADTSGVVNIFTNAPSKKIGLQVGGAVSKVVLYYDGSAKIQTDATGATVSGSAKASAFIKDGGTNQEILLADGSTTNLVDAGNIPTISTTSGYTKSANASTITINSFRMTKYGNIVTLNIKSSGTMSGNAGTPFITITDTRFRPTETIYYSFPINEASGQAQICYMTLNTNGVLQFDTGSDGFRDTQSILITFIQRPSPV